MSRHQELPNYSIFNDCGFSVNCDHVLTCFGCRPQGGENDLNHLSLVFLQVIGQFAANLEKPLPPPAVKQPPNHRIVVPTSAAPATRPRGPASRAARATPSPRGTGTAPRQSPNYYAYDRQTNPTTRCTLQLFEGFDCDGMIGPSFSSDAKKAL
ncbi:predicted protein [Chaetomium globosum CBS 148.51]|uniref:Uncharacterized protein n=1 Tax=Chaetomium globosum (strain ATCC 6205 / CBS 148.51 / DSM 1962 / NBRC 6347 / NRRL 1970) TaxID=306901 RepID=Q2GTV3_CHAGB|nr:uncharacterized protein CHGG_08601 [Chaetomium globosum CBS 148.51]EAQ84587.1 predicted protein [Chaetomium globosum CBS 148.51]